jgi:alpha-methylacyl-CoA racemase
MAGREPGSGPLAGVRVIEFAALGPVPLAAMMLSDLGADVVRVDRPGTAPGPLAGAALPGRRSIAIDLRSPAGARVALRLVGGADVLIEGYRPGTMERLGLGPAQCADANPGLVYGRMTGWGQSGPLSQAAGHDINYLSLSGALHAIGRPPDRPVPPLNLVADYGGGAMLLAFGVAAALYERSRSGRGQVIDAAMADGLAALTTPLHALVAQGRWRDVRGSNFLDSAAPNYDVYECADGGCVAVGALEPQFYRKLLDTLAADCPELGDALVPAPGPSDWPAAKAALQAAFRQRSRDYWTQRFSGVDACVTPVLSLGEAPHHEHHRARGTYISAAGAVRGAPAPRFSRTPGAVGPDPAVAGEHTREILAELGLAPGDIAALIADHVVTAAASPVAEEDREDLCTSS